MIAASATKPRPAVMFCTHWVTSESASCAPASPHSTPHPTQARNFIRSAGIPALGAAAGSSPAARSALRAGA